MGGLLTLAPALAQRIETRKAWERSEVPEVSHRYGAVVAAGRDEVVISAAGDGAGGSAFVIGRGRFTSDINGWTYREKHFTGGSQTLLGPVASDEDIIVYSVGAESSNVNVPDGEPHIVIYTSHEFTTAWWWERNHTGSDVLRGEGYGEALGATIEHVVVGAPRHGLSEPDLSGAGAAYVFERDADSESWTEAAKLVSPNAAVDGGFGRQVAVSAEWIAVADNHEGGTVYLFGEDVGGSDQWGLHSTITAPEGAPFGFSARIDLDGDTLVVSAPAADDGEAGAVYFYQQDQGGDDQWGLAGSLTPFSQLEGFGSALSISGDIILVANDPQVMPQQVHRFDRHTGGVDNWGESETLIPSDGQEGISFGESVSVLGSTAVIGAPISDGLPGTAGGAYVYDLGPQAESVKEEFIIQTSGPGLNNGFGEQGDISGDTVAVAAPADDSEGKTGSVSIYERNLGGPDQWGLLKVIRAESSEHVFGLKVSLSGDVLAVNLREKSTSIDTVLLFERDAGGADNWGQVKHFDTPLPKWGWSNLEVDGDRCLVGAPRSNSDFENGFPNRGSAALYQRDEGGAGNWGLVKMLVPSESFRNHYVGRDVAISGDWIALLADSYGNDGAPVVLLYGRNAGGSDQWGLVREVPYPEGYRDIGAGQVDLDGDTLAVGFSGASYKELHGAVRIHSRQQGGTDGWGFVTTLSPIGPSRDYIFFGSRISVSDSRVLVGRSNSPHSLMHLFTQDQGGADQWGQSALLAASDVADYQSHPGGIAALDGGSALIGSFSPGDKAYVFELPQPGAPEITVQAGDLIVECADPGLDDALDDWLDSNGGAVATDDDGAVTWSNSFTGLNGAGPQSVEVTFTARDINGIRATTSGRVTIQDTTAPEITTGPQPLAVSGSGVGTDQISPWLESFGGAVATDACGTVTWSHDFVVLPVGVDSQEVTFTASDPFGNQSSAVALLTVRDDAPPLLRTPANAAVIECNPTTNDAAVEAWLDSRGGATASDNHGYLVWSHDFNGLSGDCTRTARVTFTARDVAGNSVTTAADLRVQDSTPPLLVTPPVDLNLSCRGGSSFALDSWLLNRGGATVMDACGAVTWSHNYVSLPVGCPAELTVSFTATDSCGNATLIPAQITVQSLETWTGPTVGFWSSATNWLGGYVPRYSGDVFIDLRGDQQSAVTMNPGVTASIDNLMIGAGDRLAISDRATLRVDDELIANAGSIDVEAGGLIEFNASPLRLAGEGVLTLEGSALLAGFGELQLESTIEGEGKIGDGDRMSLVLEETGLIHANLSGRAIRIEPNDFGGRGLVNHGVIRASNGGLIEILGEEAPGFDNQGGILEALEGSQVLLAGPLVATGGEVRAEGTGSVRIAPGSGRVELRELALSGNLRVLPEGELKLVGSILNRDAIEIEGEGRMWIDGALQNEGSLTVREGGSLLGPGTLSGGGTVSLEAGTLSSSLQIGDTVVTGHGRLGNVTNRADGLILANVVGETLTLDSGFTNEGVLRVADGGRLLILGGGSGVDNEGGLIEALGGTKFFLDEASIEGGTLKTGGDASIETIGGIAGFGPKTVIENIVLDARLVVTTDTVLELGGEIENRGRILIEPSNSTPSGLVSGFELELTGGGTIELNPDQSLGTSSIDGFAWVRNFDNTIEGAGAIGKGFDLRLSNEEGGLISANQSGRFLELSVADAGFLGESHLKIKESFVRRRVGGW